ncbi:hypothetical protein H6770_03510 [Candidatus Peribacteria bacterium]|nr:hypothetical protein [Candidatus Peribacteria bacterium]
MMHFFHSLTSILTPVAFAQGPCVGITCGAGGNPLPLFISVAAAVVLEIASGLAVVSVVVGGAMLVLNFGNESRAERGRKGIFYGLVAFAVALSSQAIISFAVSKANLVEADAPHISIMNVTVSAMLAVFNVVFALMMLFFGFKLVLARGQQGELDTTKKGLAWAVTGAIGVNLSYALIRATSLLGF